MRYKHKETHIMQLQGIRLKIELNSEMKHISNYTNLPHFETNSRIGCRTSRDSFYCITECPVRRPVARGVQTGAIAPPPLDARSAWQAIILFT